jgi:chorismate-pyruvate lyase
MDEPLAHLLATYAKAHADYTLARLEYAMSHGAKKSPPAVSACDVSPEAKLREAWSRIEAQLDAALGYVLAMERDRRRRRKPDARFVRLAAALKELDRSSRAVRWALTISESHYDI